MTRWYLSVKFEMYSAFALPVLAVQSESICNTHTDTTHTNALTTVTLPRVHVLGLIMDSITGLATMKDNTRYTHSE